MTVKYCASCEGKVSAALDSCPHCGHPISEKSESMLNGYRDSNRTSETHNQDPIIVPTFKTVQTVEQTAKKWKIRILISWGMIFFGIPLTLILYGINSKNLQNPDYSPSVFIATVSLLAILMVPIGIVFLIYTKIMIWWHHK